MNKEFAEPLYEKIYVATKQVWRISTNGCCIYFDPDWLQKLGDVEIDFILSHQLMHIALGHTDRPAYYRGDRYHLAADIAANGKLSTMGWKYDKIPHIGKIRYETFFPTYHGADITSVEAIKCVPIDPSVMEPSKRRQFMIDSEEWWDKKDDMGESGTIVLCPRDEEPDDLEYNGPTYGGSIRFSKEFFPQTPDEDGAEKSAGDDSRLSADNGKGNSSKNAVFTLREELKLYKAGAVNGLAERAWNRKNAGILDWRSILDSFVQEEVNDYSFTPPDRRMQDSDFFLPDYNVFQETVRDVLFMIDTSGSIPDQTLAIVYDEIYQALLQFQGALNGMAAFFDTQVYRPTPFRCVSDINKMRPYGGGGTDYRSIFRFIRSNRTGNLPSSVVIFTDGEGIYPDEAEADHIPVLWLLTGEGNPPWGKSVRVEI